MRSRILAFVALTLLSFRATAQVTPRIENPNDTLQSRTPAKTRLIFQLEHESGGELKFNERSKETLADSYYSGLNFRVGFQTQFQDSLKSIYNEIYNYPIYGIGIYSSTFGQEHLGRPFAAYGFVAIPIRPKVNSRWNFNYRIALGLSGRFNPYNEEDNPFNLLIGSKNNVFIDLGLQVNYRLNKNFQVGAGAAFHHFSNGALALPNTGINLVPLSLSVSYTPTNKPFDYRKSSIPQMEKTEELHFNYAFGFKQIDREHDSQYFKSMLGAYYSKHFGYKWRLGAGFDAFYSASGNDEKVAGDKAGKFSALFSYGPAFYIDHVLNSRLYINGNVGVYLHRNEFNGESMPVYLRAGVRYKVYKDFFAGVSIKAHGGKADFIEWTTGYGIKLGKKRK
ncbi:MULTISPECIES: acyloxyacyl hydrolase [Sphingobacterium]|jgi:hypothetical protein|uniref:Lipid A 3-O-deacylase (PagL) n=1 Tax=Sphingobacterium multivorum TaxID=28454 RepID=A0A2X2IYY7_SPHMU|nr:MULTISPECIES: acyloxyacyl hydrolase [Sphingobacterium]HAE65798.1 deacylase [Sphingobacterium sp.]QQT43057.1 acyloxyacyl hydrolase [Sphingobacterium multivorum]QQT64010.1 acyloxyacyl hydrolase [Sphingobacterium multivorum]QRQ60736.1 acyloxyacyl hydrolase [Sphingobacterium multivorum]SPZ87502.1 Lipid A 3-O-deacylase (PagL) [Sphingobacterium multivorum]